MKINMAKRGPTSVLNHDNWDAEDEPEEAGSFTVASSDELKGRVIKKAKRRSVKTTADGSTPFAAFAGFASKNSNSTALSNFSFGLKNNSTGSNLTVESKKHEASTNRSSSEEGDSEKYYDHLRCLNEGVLAWIQKHITKNPYCILTPVFDDYKKHLNDLEDKYKITDVKTVPSTRGFSFSTTSTGSGDFLFANSTTVAQKSDPSPADAGENDKRYVPPVNDFCEVKEDGAFYSQKCKLFYKKDEGFVDKGVGNVHLKSIEGKTQLLIRADTNLGNILLNIILLESIPASRKGKNNVMIVCIPNPPIDPKQQSSTVPIPLLIRVKTSDDADRLLQEIEKHKT